jgi:low affinity Fe/Cu permease
MRHDLIAQEYDEIVNRGSYISGFSFFICMVLAFGLVFIPLLFGPMIVSNGVTLLLLAGVLCSVIVLMVVVQHSRLQRLFRNSDIHSHDDECFACGNNQVFGPKGLRSNIPPYVQRMANKCRHADDLMSL